MVTLILFLLACSKEIKNQKENDEYKKQLETLFFYSTPPISLDSMYVILKENEIEKNDPALTFLYREIGKKERQRADFSEAIRLHRLGLEAANRINDTIEIVQALNNLATDFRRVSMLSEAGSHHFQALQLSNIYSQKNSPIAQKNRLSSLNGIGNVAFAINLLDSAEFYFRMALREEEMISSPFGQAINYANIGSVFESRQMYDSALVYYQKSMEKNKEAGSTLGISLCHIHFGNIYKYKERFKESKEQYKQAYLLLEETPDKWHWLEACLSLAQLKMDINKQNEALPYIHKARHVAESIHSPEHLSRIHNLFYQYDAYRGDYFSALTEYKLYKQYTDSLQGNKMINEVIDTRIQYEKEKNNHNIARLHARTTLEKQKKQTFLIVSFIVLIVLIASLILLFYALWQRTKSNRVLNKAEQIRSDFFTKITHEFRTPLTVILGLSRQLKEKDHISPQASNTYLNAIERQGKNP